MARKSATLTNVKGKGPKTNSSRRPLNRVRQDASETSDEALANLLRRLKDAVDPNEIAQISNQIERVVFHKQFKNA